MTGTDAKQAYTIETTFQGGFEEAVAATRAALADAGFGVITEIDATATFKKKLDVDFAPYLILGACSPGHAHRVLTAEPEVGVLLPCNVVIRQAEDGVRVLAMDPGAAMSMTRTPVAALVAAEVRDLLQGVIERVGRG